MEITPVEIGVRIAGLTLIVGLLAFARQLGGYENKSIGRVLNVFAAGLGVTWGFWFLTRWVAWMLFAGMVIGLLVFAVRWLRTPSSLAKIDADAIPRFKGKITDVSRSKMLFASPQALGTAIDFNLHFRNDSTQRSAIQSLNLTVADRSGHVFDDNQPTIFINGSPQPLPRQAYQRGDADLFRVKASFRDLDYDAVNLRSLTVRLVDTATQEDHFIRA